MNKATKEVSSLIRGLAVMNELNRAGSARAGSLARGLGLARPTVYRLLDTLEDAGFVAKSASDERYRITPRAALFSERYSVSVGGTAGEILQAAAMEGFWLLHVSTLEAGSMVVTLTGRPSVPVLPTRGYMGRSLPLLASSAGKAFVAACDEIQLREITDRARPTNDASAIDSQIDSIRAEIGACGYAISTDPDANVSNLSVGVSHAGKARGALTAVVISAMLDTDSARRQLADSLHGLSIRLGPHVSDGDGMATKA